MFEQSFVGVSAKTNRGAPLALSLILQFSLVGTALLVPLLNPEILPRAVWSALPLAAPPPPPPPPAPAQVMRQVIKTVRSVMAGAVMMLPARIPEKVRIIDDGELTAAVSGSRDGVIGGLPTGVPDGVVRSVMSDAARALPPPATAEPMKVVEGPKPVIRQKIGGNVQEAMLISRVIPVYPVLARQARVEGKVVFAAVIGVHGTIQSLRVKSGPALLVQAAMDAVKQWRYRPTLLNGDPCEVDTVIEVNFTLNR
ncbi:MAG: energy transducer TonB [Acidobacteria bacterium]|nr:energy transducer TonB [Acidobacteriota bacterium]